jgi:hypothetical protein
MFSGFRLVLKFGISLSFLTKVVNACCRAAKPDPTFVDTTEYFLTSITPNRGTRAGGSRVTLKGGGFNVNFFTAGNYVYIGSDSTSWVPCDVIEGMFQSPPTPLHSLHLIPTKTQALARCSAEGPTLWCVTLVNGRRGALCHLLVGSMSKS